jgi:hypothetical protein
MSRAERWSTESDSVVMVGGAEIHVAAEQVAYVAQVPGDETRS